MLIKQSKLIRLNKGFKIKAVLALITLILLTCFGCGKRTPPLPPIERVAQRVEISGFQQGDSVNLSWVMPVRNASDGNTLNIDKIEIYRLAEALTSSLSLTEEEFASQSTLIGSVPVSPDDFARKQLFYRDKLE